MTKTTWGRTKAGVYYLGFNRIQNKADYLNGSRTARWVVIAGPAAVRGRSFVTLTEAQAACIGTPRS